MVDFEHIDWCSGKGAYGDYDCSCPDAEFHRPGMVVTPEAIQALLLDHRPAICENFHFVCSSCKWHESFTGTEADLKPDDVGKWWDEFVLHLTAPAKNKEGLN